MIITIDGPAGAGKSTVARTVAEELGFEFLDTGAMYRCVALRATRDGVDWDDVESLATLARGMKFELAGTRVWLDGEEVTHEIRTPEITSLVKHVADPPVVRHEVVGQQQEWGKAKDLVTEGRDQGTVVFPDAECKIFLTASPEVRAKRRFEQLPSSERTNWQSVLEQQNERDRRDEQREVGRLVAAGDAVELCTDTLTQSEVVSQILELARNRGAGAEAC